MKNNSSSNIKGGGILSKFLFEQENVIAPSQTDPVVVPSNISLDQKVDKYLVSYEKESVPMSNDYNVPGNAPIEPTSPESPQGVPPPVKTVTVGESKKYKATLTSLLFEADEDAPAPDDTTGGDAPIPDPGSAEGGDMGGGGAPVPSDSPVISTPKINLNHFGTGIARLINNYESLLNPKVTILNRAIEYIKVNYDEPTSKQFKEMMEQNFDLRVEEPQRDGSLAPLAAGAAADGSSGGGAA